ncbi:MAG: hypothetical protein O3C27_08440 [Actinomycetota bacterium]|nr:hypothetical protein [Actinomycetota bacterium]
MALTLALFVDDEHVPGAEPTPGAVTDLEFEQAGQCQLERPPR